MSQPFTETSIARVTLCGGPPHAYDYAETRWRFPGAVYIVRIPVGCSSENHSPTSTSY